MNFSWFRKKPDPLLERAENLINAANILGIGSYTDLSAKLPIVNNIDTEQWDWVFTIAGVFVAVNRLNSNANRIEASTKEEIHDVVTQKLAAWKPDGLGGLQDCQAFFKKTYEQLSTLDSYKSDPSLLISDSLGMWMTWNLIKHAPESEDERKLARMTGAFAFHAFVNWWKIS
ncbi:MAG: hypothetical protein Q8N04_15705 [Nitrospira sp.]|nr:hypothetical protein [Nitrospira sp.]